MTSKSRRDLRTAAVWPAAPYVLAYTVALFFSVAALLPIGVTAIWPANAIPVAGLLLVARPSRLWIALPCCAANLVIALLLHASPVLAFFLSAPNLVECCALVWLTRRVCGNNLDFSDARRLVVFLAGAVIPACLISLASFVGPSLLLAHLPLPPGAAWNWFVSHALGAAMVVPVVTVIATRRRFASMARSNLELSAAMALLVVLSVCVVWWQAQLSLMFLIFPALMLVAFRYGPVGAAVGSLIFAGVAGLFVYAGPHHAALGFGPNLPAKVAWLQVFIVAVFMTTLPAAGAVASYTRMRTLLARRTLTARQARHRADCAAAAKGEFLANMSHEIRTPLNGVIGLAYALSRTELEPAQREMLGMILGSGKALTGLLSDALDLARADSGALVLADEAFEVREAIGSAVYLFEAIAQEKGLNFDVSFDLDPPGAVVGDALRIKQVVSNLISNAVKFTSAGSISVGVSLKPADDGRLTLAIVVRDTGPGFDEAVKARLFNRFEQGDGSVTRRFGGSGLGLSIVKRLSQLMGAAVDCDAVPGVGATFRFAVALRPAEPAAAVPDEPDASAGHDDERRLSVLVAEDHVVNRKVIQALLGDTVDLTLTVDGQDALDAFGVAAFDVVLMDTHMPVMDGLTAIRAIRALEAERGLPRTPIVSLTADAMPQQIEAAHAAGADLHLAKPITGESLYTALHACRRLNDSRAPIRPADGPRARAS